jgi:ATP-dependent RNA helicase DOB1
MHDSPNRVALISQFDLKQRLGDRIRLVQKNIAATRSIIQLDQLKCRKRVLRRLGYITDADVIEMKGRVACEISSGGHELLLTEMMFQGVFNDLDPTVCASILSCFTTNEKVCVVIF